jgi:hypothetical protein
VKARTLAGVALALLVASTLVLASLWLRGPRGTRVMVGDVAPDVELSWAEPVGSAHLLGMRAPATIVAFFDATSASGKRVARNLEAVQARFRGYGLVVVGVALDNSRLDVLDMVQGSPAVTFFVFHDPGGERVRPGWGEVRVGESYLLGPDRKVIKVYPDGFQWPDQELRDTLLRILPPPLPARAKSPR